MRATPAPDAYCSEPLPPGAYDHSISDVDVVESVPGIIHAFPKMSNILQVAESARPRLFIVGSATDSAGRDIVDSLSSLGVPRASGGVRAALTGILEARTGAVAACVSAASQHAAATLGWDIPVLSGTPSVTLDVLSDAGFSVSTIIGWQEPSQVAAVAAGPARAVALARWETAVRWLLAAFRGRPCLVLPPGSGTASRSALSAYVAGALRTPEEGGKTTSAVAAPVPRHRPAEEDGVPTSELEVLGSQGKLAEILRALIGVHGALTLPRLSPVSCWTAALSDAEKRARASAVDAAEAWAYAHERSQDAQIVWRALWQVSRELAHVVDDESAHRHEPVRMLGA